MLKWVLHCICCDGNPGNIKVNSDLIRCHCYRRQKVISWDNKSFKVKDCYDETYSAFGMASSIREIYPDWVSPQCRSILGGRNLVRVRNIVVVAIFDFMTYSGRLGRVRNSNPLRGRKKERTRPISSSLRKVSTWHFREEIACSKKTPALQAKTELQWLFLVRFILTSLHSEFHISP